MPFDLSNIRTDPKKALDGVWMKLDPEGTVKLLIARANNPKFQAFLQEKALGKGKVTPRKLREMISTVSNANSALMTEAIAKFILLGWEGLKEDGNVVEYSVQEAIRVLGDPRYSEFKDIVLEMAQDTEEFREDAIEEVAGN